MTYKLTVYTKFTQSRVFVSLCKEYQLGIYLANKIASPLCYGMFYSKDCSGSVKRALKW